MGNNQPLFVIDGIPIDNSTDPSNETGSVNGLDFKDYGKVIGSNRAADINPDDIASLTVLKGGAATALYGIRAVNGAIIITTKSGLGLEEGLNLNFSTGYSVDVVNKYPQFTEKYARGRNGLYSNITHWSWGPAYADNPNFPSGTTLDLDGNGTKEDVSGEPIPLYRGNYKNFFQNGFKTNNNVSVSKATDAGSFYMSLGNFNQEGVVENNTYQRSNFSLKGSFNVNENFKIGGLANFANIKAVNFQGGDTGYGSGLSYYHHMWDIKNRPWIDSNSERTWFSAFVADPKWIVNEEGENSKVDRLVGNINLSYNFFPWLRLNAIGGIDTFSDQRKLVRPISSVNTVGRNGDLYEIKTNSKDVTFNVNVSGDLSINDDLSFNYLAGLDYYDKKYNRLFLSGTELLVKNFTDISNAKNYNANRIDANKRIVGFFGELNFDYKNFLFLSITGRNDWSSTLPK
ncbi:MAG: TonB-dependent receptor plug domain-containing protein [Bacteroidetes bacterium]|nr:TonB-dependent receptor plug domain-containing protein [Bacteroidota bacterium]MDA0937378.1 TonB-dependent receptor plug domain-containing protein [Bacteroidota bacterium]MDA1344754.1 TonB-dependent receptor plug domain-containing protein [Bacteroidota bacterium]